MKIIPSIAIFLIFASLIFSLIFKLENIEPEPQNFKIKQNEITKQGDLFDSEGYLAEVGWSKKALKNYNIDQLPLLFFSTKVTQIVKFKAWDFYSVFTPNFIAGFYIAELGLFSQIQFFVKILNDNIEDNYIAKTTQIFLKPRQLTQDSLFHKENLKLGYETGNFNLSFENIDNYKKKFTINCAEPNFTANLNFQRGKNFDEIVMYSPLSKDHTKFYYNVKGYNHLVEGEMRFKNQKFLLNGLKTNGGYDLGRGIWNYNSFWLWGHGQGFLNDGQTRIGLNLGGGFQNFDEQKASEDSIFLGGKIIKLNTAKFTFSEDTSYESWTFNTKRFEKQGDCQITFKPLKDQRFYDKVFYLVFQSELRQYYGYFEGKVMNENKEIIQFHKVLGFCEVHRAMW